MDKKKIPQYWIQIYSQSYKDVQDWFDMKKTILRFILLAMVILVAAWRWGGVQFALSQATSLLYPEAIFLIIIVFIVPIAAIPHMFWVAAKQDKKQKEKITALEAQLDNSEIDILLEPSPSPNGEYVSIKVTNNNQTKPVLCKAIVRKMQWFKQDPKNENGGEWVSINLERSGPLSWHHGGSDSEGFKKVYFNPEFINIAKVSTDMNQLIRGNIIFTFLAEEPHKAGRYKIWVDILCQHGEKSKVETWMGCIDTVDPLTKNDLTIMECEDVKEWKK